MLWRFSVRRHIVIALGFCMVGTCAAWWFFTNHQHAWLPWLASWMLVVNLVAFAYYGVDKWLAQRLLWRIPELTLHTLSVIGGSPGALLAMWFFRHKTIKSSFRVFFWSVVIVQIALTIYIVKLLWWN